MGFLHFRFRVRRPGARIRIAEDFPVNQDDGFDELTVDQEVRDIADVPAVEVINTVAVHLLSAAAVKV